MTGPWLAVSGLALAAVTQPKYWTPISCSGFGDMRHAACSAFMVARCGLAPREECPAAIQTHSDTSSAVYVPLLQSLRTHSLSSSTIGYCAPSRILSSRDHRRADAFCAESSLPREPSCAPPLSHVHYVLGGPRLCWTPVHADGAGPTLTCAQTAPRECRNASTTRSRARSARPCRWHPRGRRPARPPA